MSETPQQPPREPEGTQPPSYGQYGTGYEPPAQDAPQAPSYGQPHQQPHQQPQQQPQQPGYGQPSYGPPPGQQQGYAQQGGYPSGYPQQGGYGAPAGELSPQDQRLWACLAHVSAIVAGIVLSAFTGGTIYLGAIGPLVLYFVFRERGVFVRRQTTEALNFSILLTVVYLALVLLTLVTLGIGALLTVPAIVVISIVALVFQIIAAVKANQGVDYRYPVNWRLVK